MKVKKRPKRKVKIEFKERNLQIKSSSEKFRRLQSQVETPIYKWVFLIVFTVTTHFPSLAASCCAPKPHKHYNSPPDRAVWGQEHNRKTRQNSKSALTKTQHRLTATTFFTIRPQFCIFKKAKCSKYNFYLFVLLTTLHKMWSYIKKYCKYLSINLENIKSCLNFAMNTETLHPFLPSLPPLLPTYLTHFRAHKLHLDIKHF